MARCLIVACGCRGQALAAELRARGHAVRGTTRREAGLDVLEAAGVEGHLGDPDRVATMVSAFDHVSVVCLLLGSASGPAESVAELHGPRLDMLLSKLLDTTARGVVYEAAGSVPPAVLSAGAERVEAVCRDSRIPHALLRHDPTAGWQAWLQEALSAVLGLLDPAPAAA